MTLLTVMPGLETATVEPARKLEPARVTGTAEPWLPEEGLTEVSEGAGGLTVNVAGALVPLRLETVTVEAPRVALPAIEKVAVIWFELTTTTLLTVMPGFEAATVEPARKLDPETVTGTELPRIPEVGLREEMTGKGAVMEKGTAEVVPAEVETVTLKEPRAAAGAMENVAVI